MRLQSDSELCLIRVYMGSSLSPLTEQPTAGEASHSSYLDCYSCVIQEPQTFLPHIRLLARPPTHGELIYTGEPRTRVRRTSLNLARELHAPSTS